jgi:hypothetical protein
VVVVGSKTRLTYIIESILAIQSTSNGKISDRKTLLRPPIKWELVAVVGSKTRLTYIIESILAIQSTSNGKISDIKTLLRPPIN